MKVKRTPAKVLSIGAKAPNFALTDRDGTEHTLAAMKADYVVIYFYPRDSTPGCTLEAQEFSSLLAKFARRKALVIGISGGTDRTKAAFCDKFDLAVTLLSDTDFAVAADYGVFGEKKFMGRTFLGVRRTTFLLDSQKRILKVFHDVKAKGHAAAVLALIDELSGARPSRVTAKAKASRRPRSAP